MFTVRRLYSTLFILILCILPSGCGNRNNTVNQESVAIKMEYDGGVYKVPCKVNGARMKMIFDTGASDVCLSSSIAEYLLDNDYLSENDFGKVGHSVVADGRVTRNVSVNLKDVEICGIHLENVSAIVTESLSAPILLGQSAISRLGQITIKGDSLYINKPLLPKDEIPELDLNFDPNNRATFLGFTSDAKKEDVIKELKRRYGNKAFSNQYAAFADNIEFGGLSIMTMMVTFTKDLEFSNETIQSVTILSPMYQSYEEARQVLDKAVRAYQRKYSNIVADVSEDDLPYYCCGMIEDENMDYYPIVIGIINPPYGGDYVYVVNITYWGYRNTDTIASSDI